MTREETDRGLKGGNERERRMNSVGGNRKKDGERERQNENEKR